MWLFSKVVRGNLRSPSAPKMKTHPKILVDNSGLGRQEKAIGTLESVTVTMKVGGLGSTQETMLGDLTDGLLVASLIVLIQEMTVG